MVDRRSVLQLSGTSLVIGLAGCSVFSDDSIHLGKFTVSNFCYESQTIHLVVEDGGTEVYREIVGIEAAPDDPDEQIDLSHEVPPQPPREAGNYRIYARLDAGDEWDEADAINRDLSCIEIDFQIKCGQLEGQEREPYISMMGAVVNPDCPQVE